MQIIIVYLIFTKKVIIKEMIDLFLGRVYHKLQKDEMIKFMKTDITKLLEKEIISATRRQGVFGVLECTIGWYGKEIVDYITYDTNGIFRCYELKCTVSDFHSKAAKSFLGHYNYYVLTQELYNQIKTEIPEHIGVYIHDTLIKKAKKQDLESLRPEYLNTGKFKEKTMSDILKDSMIRSLNRETQKLYDSGNDSVIQRKNREINRLQVRVKEEHNKYIELVHLLYQKFGSRCLRKIEQMPDYDTVP